MQNNPRDSRALPVSAFEVFIRALTRLWGRDVMLYVGGVSFFSLLAVFPAIAIAIGVFSLFGNPSVAAQEGHVLSRLVPEGARELVEGQLIRLAQAPRGALSTQSVVALLVGLYAAQRGFKALLAGLSFIHDEDEPRGFVGFNLLAFAVLLATFALLGVVSSVFFGLRILGSAFDLKPLGGVSWLFSEWTWTSAALTLGLAFIYRFAMSRRPVAWSASVAGGLMATAICIFASWATAFYVEQITTLGVTYGSVATVVVFLIWLSWNVNAIFFGGALATEVELALAEAPVIRRPRALRPRS